MDSRIGIYENHNINRREMMIRCPDCKALVSLNYHFGAYICSCGWMDDSYNMRRIEQDKINRRDGSYERPERQGTKGF